MQIYKTRTFAKFAEKKSISDDDLIEAIERAERGLIDAELGANIIKQRIARPNSGKSSGYRALIFYKFNHNHFFVVGFSKSKQENLSKADENALKLLAKQYRFYTESQITQLIEQGILIKVVKNEI